MRFAPLRQLVAGLGFALAGASSAQEALHAPDVDVLLSGVLVEDRQLVTASSLSVETLGGLPETVEVTGYNLIPGGDRVFSIDTVALLGGVIAHPWDVIRFDGSNYTREIDGRAAGLPPGARIDAVSSDGSGGYVLSFDVTVDVGGQVFSDEDLVHYDGVFFTLLSDLSSLGFDPALDLDAVFFVSGFGFSFSFDTGGTHPAFGAFSDEDVILYDAGTGNLGVIYDGSAFHAGWEPADLGALPEPGTLPGLCAGLTLLHALSRRRTRENP